MPLASACENKQLLVAQEVSGFSRARRLLDPDNSQPQQDQTKYNCYMLCVFAGTKHEIQCPSAFGAHELL